MAQMNVNLENLSETERAQLLQLIEKSNQTKTKLSEIAVGKTFRIGDMTFIKLSENNGAVEAITKNVLFASQFGDNNDFRDSIILKKLQNDILPKVIAEAGEENVITFETDLTAFDGLKQYGKLTSKISLPTLDDYRKYVEILDRYSPKSYWWLSTPDSMQPHDDPDWILCVSPSGNLSFYYYCNDSLGVRPFFHFASSLFVSHED